VVQDSDFNNELDEIFERLEDELDELDESVSDGLDIDSSGGLLTISFNNGSVIVLSRQIANHEIWVAAKSGGFHLSLHSDPRQWYCNTTSESLSTLISRVFTEQLGLPVQLLADPA